MGRIKRVFKSLVLIILAMLSITIINKGLGKIVYADKTIIKNSASPTNFPESLPAYITYEDLISRYNLLCVGKGMGLPGYGSTSVKSGSHSTHTTDQGKDTGKLTVGDLGTQTVFAGKGYTDLVDTTSKTYGYYTEATPYKATPAEAYILANLNDNVPGNGVKYKVTDKVYTGKIEENEFINIKNSDGEKTEKIYITSYNTSDEPTGYAAKRGDKYYVVETESTGGDGNYSAVQYAWWAVAHVNEGRILADNSLAQEARHFESYIKSLGYTGSSKDQVKDGITNDVGVVERDIVTDEAGEFKISYPIKTEYKDAEVRFNQEKNKYIIGPFNINYTRDIAKFGDRPTVDFAGITSSTLQGKFKTKNAKGEVVEEVKTIDFGSHYNFVYEHSHQEYRKKNPNWTIDTDVSYPYPYDNEKFYIELDYLEDLVSLTNLKFDFHYLNGGGSYEVLHGSYLIIQWKAINTGITAAGTGLEAYTQNAKATLLNFTNTSAEWNLEKVANIRKGNEEITLKSTNVARMKVSNVRNGLKEGEGKVTGLENVKIDGKNVSKDYINFSSKVKMDGDKINITINLNKKVGDEYIIKPQTIEAYPVERDKKSLYFSGKTKVSFNAQKGLMGGNVSGTIDIKYECLNKLSDFINDGNITMKALKPTVGLTLGSGSNPGVTMKKAGFLQDEEYYQIKIHNATTVDGKAGHSKNYTESSSTKHLRVISFKQSFLCEANIWINIDVPKFELENNSINLNSNTQKVIFYNACKANVGKGPGIKGKDGALKLPKKLSATIDKSKVDSDLGDSFKVDSSGGKNSSMDGYIFANGWGWHQIGEEVVGLNITGGNTISGLTATITANISDKGGNTSKLTINYKSSGTAIEDSTETGSGSEGSSGSGSSSSTEGGSSSTPITETIEGALLPVSATANKAQPHTILTGDDDDDDNESITVVKQWEDNLKTNIDGKTEELVPVEITVRLYKNGKPTDKTAKLNESNKWTHTFKNLPKIKGMYTAKEIGSKIKIKGTEKIATDIFFKVSTSVDGKVVTIKNSIGKPKNEKVTIKGEKTWDDDENKEGKRPEKATVTLYKNGNKTSETREVSAKNNWKYEFKDLTKYDDKGEEIIYTVVETDVHGYTATYDGYNIRNISIRKTEIERGGAWISDHTVSEEFWKGDFEIDLTTSIAGMVWEDKETAKKGEELSANGIYKKDEDKDIPLSKIEVKIWKVVYEKKTEGGITKYEEVTKGVYARKLADAYKTKQVSEGGSVKLADKINFSSDKKSERLYTSSEDKNIGKYRAYLNVPSIQGLDTKKYKVSYDVEFLYDGQTYEVTEYLASTGEKNTAKKVEKFESTSNATRDDASKPKKMDYSAYKNDSYAIETYKERSEFDSKFTDIHGYNTYDKESEDTGAIDKEGNGKTKGKTTKADLEYNRKEISIKDESDSKVDGNKEKRSESILITKDNDGYVLDKFKMKARTSTAGLLLPYEDLVHVEDKKEDIPLDYIDTKESGKYTYYKPINEYFSQINLGLVQRNETDVAVTQDLYKAGVVVNQDELTYKYNTLVDLENAEYSDRLNMLLDMQATNVNYELGLYASDFYYRSDVYKAENKTITKNILYKEKKASELRLFASYRISVYNDSRNQDVSINRLSDYYDSSFTLVNDNIKANLKDENGITKEKVIAEPSYYRIYAPLAKSPRYKYNKTEDIAESDKLLRATEKETKAKTGTVHWKTTKITKQVGEGESKGTYNKMYTDTFTSVGKDGKYTTNELTLHPGEKIEIFVSFEVDHDGYSNIVKKSDSDSSAYGETKEEKDKERKDLLGNKNSVAEVSSYSVYYTKDSLKKNNNVAYKAGEISGKVDKDSAPDNINFNKTEEVTIGEKKYTVLSKEYFDDDTESAPIFRIYLRDYKDKEREINGAVWEDDLTEQVKDESTNTKTGNGKLDEDKNKVAGATVTLVEKIKISDKDNPDDITEYEYVWPDNAFGTGIPNYTSVTMSDKNGNYNFKNFVSGNYVVRFEYGNTAMTLKYNGQDYKNTSYQQDIKNPTKDEIDKEYNEDLKNNDQKDENKFSQITLNNEWHDLSGSTKELINDGTRVSDARDYEARRLDIASYSRTINNSIAEVLATADSKETKELYNELCKIMFNDKGELIVNYGTALKKVTETNKELEKFVNSDNYKALIAFVAMEANTAKLKIQIEEPEKLDFGQTKKSVNGTFKINTSISYDKILETLRSDADESTNKDYTVKNIDFGIERRADTIIQLDKFLTHIQLQKDSTAILDADIDENGNVSVARADKTLNTDKIVSVSESNGVQGFKYINIEEQYLRDTQVILDYKIKVTNKSEVDYSSEKVVATYTPTLLNELIEKSNSTLKSGEDIKYGEYIGLYYYTHDISAVGKDKEIAGGKYIDKDVRTTVDQLVDYVDPSTSFVTTATENNYWPSVNATKEEYKITNGQRVNYLKGLISDDSYTMEAIEKDGAKTNNYYLQDDTTKDNMYISETKNNIAISNNNQINKVTKDKIILERGDKGERKLTYEFRNKDEAKETGIEKPTSSYVGDSKVTTESIKKVSTENVWQYIKDVGESYKVDVYNKDLTRELETINLKGKDAKESTAEINITTSINTGNGTKIDDMIYDNLAEVLVYSNSVGRRSMVAIPGNAFEIAKQVAEDATKDDASHKYGGVWNAGHSSNSKKNTEIIKDLDEKEVQDYQKTMRYALNTRDALNTNTDSTTSGVFIAELDSDAADFVTFTEPTGLNYAIQQQNKIIMIMLIALVILATGIIIITIKVVMAKTTDNITIESTKE